MTTIEFTILEDGTLSIKTGAVADTVHKSADLLLEEVDKLMGGAVTRKENPEKKQHAHTHHSAFAK